MDFQDLGYNIASGKVGTKWMEFTKSDIDDMLQEKPSPTVEDLDEWAQGWEETLQYQHEVGTLIEEALEKQGYKKSTEDYVYAYSDLQLEYLIGYVSYIQKLFKKYKIPIQSYR